MKFMEDFILGVPYLFLKKIPYAWLGVVLFWDRPPVLSLILLGIVTIGLLMMAWQEHAWEARVMREYSSSKAKALIDHPHTRRIVQLRNLAMVLIASGLVAWILKDRLGLSGLRWFLILSGFMLLYKDAMLFGAGATYILTDRGLGIRLVPGHVDYRLFFKFHEISKAARIRVPANIPILWEMLTPQHHPREGLLLSPSRPDGFSKAIQGNLLLVPTDLQAFLERMARHVKVEG